MPATLAPVVVPMCAVCSVQLQVGGLDQVGTSTRERVSLVEPFSHRTPAKIGASAAGIPPWSQLGFESMTITCDGASDIDGSGRRLAATAHYF
jgi:hypothetical protein